MIGAWNFVFRLGGTLIGLAAAHALLVAASLTTIETFPDLLMDVVIGFCCGWFAKPTPQPKEDLL